MHRVIIYITSYLGYVFHLYQYVSIYRVSCIQYTLYVRAVLLYTYINICDVCCASSIGNQHAAVQNLNIKQVLKELVCVCVSHNQIYVNLFRCSQGATNGQGSKLRPA